MKTAPWEGLKIHSQTLLALSLGSHKESIQDVDKRAANQTIVSDFVSNLFIPNDKIKLRTKEY